MAAVFSAALLSATPAFAQPSDAEKAQKHFEDGATLYAQGNYSKAIVEFIKGHAIAPNAMFLYNISLSYLKLENITDALAAAEKARTFDGMPDKVAVRNDARIGGFRAFLSAEDLAEDIAAAAETPDPMVADHQTGEEGGALGGLGWTGIGLGLAGAGLVVGALIVNSGVDADIESLESEANGGNRARFDTLKSDIESGQSTGKILLYSGAGLATAGLVMLIIDLADGPESAGSVSVAPSDGGAKAQWSIRF